MYDKIIIEKINFIIGFFFYEVYTHNLIYKSKIMLIFIDFLSNNDI